MGNFCPGVPGVGLKTLRSITNPFITASLFMATSTLPPTHTLSAQQGRPRTDGFIQRHRTRIHSTPPGGPRPGAERRVRSTARLDRSHHSGPTAASLPATRRHSPSSSPGAYKWQ